MRLHNERTIAIHILDPILKDGPAEDKSKIEEDMKQVDSTNTQISRIEMVFTFLESSGVEQINTNSIFKQEFINFLATKVG